MSVIESPTDRKASVEDVAKNSGLLGKGIGRTQMEHIIRYAQCKLALVDLNPTSRRKGLRRMRCLGRWGLREEGLMCIG